jgi:hypothetical protein
MTPTARRPVFTVLTAADLLSECHDDASKTTV